MVRARFKPIPPDQRIRELRKEQKAIEKEPPSPERAQRLAALARDAHDERQLNLAMHTAALCLEEDPSAPTLLIEAYLEGVDDGEDYLRTLLDLDDLGRYVSRPDLSEYARGEIDRRAYEWVAEADEAERRHRLRTLTSMFDRAFADDIRDRLR